MKSSYWFKLLGMLIVVFALAHITKAVVVFSNLGTPSGGTFCWGPTTPMAHGFITDASGPYTINAITVTSEEHIGTITLAIFDDNAGNPGSQIANVGSVSITGTSANRIESTITATSAITLENNTTYWLVFYINSAFCMLSGSTGPVIPSGQFSAVASRHSLDNGVTWNPDPRWAIFALDVSPASAGTGAGLQPRFFDGRINNYDTGNPVVLYGIPDAEGNRGLYVYNPDGVLLFAVSPETIASVPECPEENTLIASSESQQISLWRLAGTCQYQLIAPTAEIGKNYIIIFNELFANGGYASHEE